MSLTPTPWAFKLNYIIHTIKLACQCEKHNLSSTWWQLGVQLLFFCFSFFPQSHRVQNRSEFRLRVERSSRKRSRSHWAEIVCWTCSVRVGGCHQSDGARSSLLDVIRTEKKKKKWMVVVVGGGGGLRKRGIFRRGGPTIRAPWVHFPPRLLFSDNVAGRS